MFGNTFCTLPARVLYMGVEMWLMMTCMIYFVKLILQETFTVKYWNSWKCKFLFNESKSCSPMLGISIEQLNGWFSTNGQISWYVPTKRGFLPLTSEKRLVFSVNSACGKRKHCCENIPQRLLHKSEIQHCEPQNVTAIIWYTVLKLARQRGWTKHCSWNCS